MFELELAYYHPGHKKNVIKNKLDLSAFLGGLNGLNKAAIGAAVPYHAFFQ